jgi:CheY-like chemotaxis protein
VLTALVVDESPAARRRVAGLLELAGWQVHEAGDAEDARWLSAEHDLDLVVTPATVTGSPSGAQLLTELRRAGSTARFLVVTTDPTDEVRAECAAAGALATLAAPVDAGLLLDLVQRRTAAAPSLEELVDVEDLHDADLDDELMARLQEMYDDALPTRLTAITSSVRAGDPRAVAAAAHTLAGTSGQLGHPDVAGLCLAIASDARRGILAHHLVAELAELALAEESAAGRVDAAQRRSRLARIRAAVQR